MALPVYATTTQRIGYYTFLTYCGLVFFFLISPNYMRAALNLGASPLHAFWKIYMPNSVPGISAGCMLVFILAIGYYITPELVGGKDGQMIGNWIAYHLKTTLNWGLSAALGAILLGVLTVLYWVYNKLVGIENIKLG